MKPLPNFSRHSRRVAHRGLTLLELLVVITIIGILSALLFPGVKKALSLAEISKNAVNLREIAVATISLANDYGNKLPSPIYPGGMEPPPGVADEDYFPEHFDLGDSGMWLDGVVFAAIYMREDKYGDVTSYDVSEDGEHLKGTLFENTMSVKQNPTEEDWHRHSYAMNANLKYDRIYDQVQSSDPYLTEKTLSNLIFAPKAMLYIDCEDENVIMAEDIGLLESTAENRYDGGQLIAAFLDGHTERIRFEDIPDEDPETDREASYFWRGVEADR